MKSSLTGKAEKIFLNKTIFLHIKGRSNTAKAAELISLFGGQIEQFLENTVSYVLTDLPPDGFLTDEIIIRARSLNVKVLSLKDLVSFCSQYLSAQSSSDDDDEKRTTVYPLKEPFIKIEDFNGQYVPTVKEFVRWPEISIKGPLPIGKSIFEDIGLMGTPCQSMNNQICYPNTPSAQLTQQAISTRTNIHANTTSANTVNQAHQQPPVHPPTPLANSNIVNGFYMISPSTPTPHKLPPQTKSNQLHPQLHSQQVNVGPHQQHRARKRHSVYCEICSQKILDKIEEHIQTPAHKANIEKTNWREVISVINSLPDLQDLNVRRIPTITPPGLSEHQEFLCLHKVESVSQLFFNSNKDNSLSPIDKKLVHIQ